MKDDIAAVIDDPIIEIAGVILVGIKIDCVVCASPDPSIAITPNLQFVRFAAPVGVTGSEVDVRRRRRHRKGRFPIGRDVLRTR
jgi:hypothetical protein